MIKRPVDRGKILRHHRFASLAVCLLNGFLDSGDRFLARQHTAQGEEASLHHRVNATAHTGLTGDLHRVNDEESKLLFNDLFLGGPGKVVPDFFRSVRTVEQKGCAGLGGREHVESLEEGELVAGHEICPADKVSGTNRPWSKAQMGDRHRTGLLRIVDKVTLGVIRRVLADNLDGVLVGTHRAIGAEPIENSAYCLRILRGKGRIIVQAGMSHVIVNAHGEVVPGAVLCHFVEDALDHAGREFL